MIDYKYLITLTSGQVILANDYYFMPSGKVCVEGVASKGTYTIEVSKDEIVDIQGE